MRLVSLIYPLLHACPALSSLQIPFLHHDTPAPDRSVSPALFTQLEELARVVDISYCISLANVGISKPFTCLSRCSEFPDFELIKVRLPRIPIFHFRSHQPGFDRHGTLVPWYLILLVTLLLIMLLPTHASLLLSEGPTPSPMPSWIYQPFHRNTFPTQVTQKALQHSTRSRSLTRKLQNVTTARCTWVSTSPGV